jgi:hypothetical protein
VKNLLFISLFVAVFLISLQTNNAFAQTTHTINIPTGAGSPDAPYFWQSEPDGRTDGKITIAINDYVNWENADTVAHTVTSGNPKDGPDRKFDSYLIEPGASFMHQFTEAGTYPYFDTVHPWMTGVVTVESSMQIIPKVGSDVGDGKTTFDVEYNYNRIISAARIDQEQKAITFELVGKPKSDDHTLTLMLPKTLINGPYVIWLDGSQVNDFQLTSKGGINELKITAKPNSNILTILGTSVIPEFGPIAMAIFAAGVFGIIAISLKAQKYFKPNANL